MIFSVLVPLLGSDYGTIEELGSHVLDKCRVLVGVTPLGAPLETRTDIYSNGNPDQVLSPPPGHIANLAASSESLLPNWRATALASSDSGGCLECNPVNVKLTFYGYRNNVGTIFRHEHSVNT